MVDPMASEHHECNGDLDSEKDAGFQRLGLRQFVSCHGGLDSFNLVDGTTGLEDGVVIRR